MTYAAPRMDSIKPSPSAMASRRARELVADGRDVISLSLGDPDFPTPDNVVAAAIRAMERGETKYTDPDGTPELKAAVREKFRRDNGFDFDLDQIIVSAGAKQVIFYALLATVAPGDEVIIPAPYWVSYPDMVMIADGVPVRVACPQNNGFRLRPEDLDAAITPRTRWLLLNSPNNPSGTGYAAADLEALADVLRRHPRVLLMSDDIYEHIVYDEFRFATMAGVAPDLGERILTVNGVSKTYAMTGWRIGFGAGPRDLVRTMVTLQSQCASNPCSISQAAALEALSGPQDVVAERRGVLEQRRDLVVERLNRCPGLACHRPQGAFYVYPSCAGVIGRRAPDGTVIASDQDFALYLLDAADVAVVPGAAYGLTPHIRVDFSGATERLEEACDRIDRACHALT